MQSRLTTVADVPALQQLITLSVRGLSQEHYTPAQIESAITHIFGIDTQLIADGTYYLLTEGDTITACGGWSKRNTLFGGDQFKAIADPLLNPATDAARIRAFFVHPGWARRGLGRQMINLCETAAREQGFTRFELGATLPGVLLYTAMGYAKIEQIEAPMADGEVLQIVRMGK
jgi:GNAT superfamily N-acetyltransferase